MRNVNFEAQPSPNRGTAADSVPLRGPLQLSLVVRWQRYSQMIFHASSRVYLACLVAINLLLIGQLPNVQGGANTSPNHPNQCVQRDSLTFNGVGLWTRLPNVLERYGHPLRIEPMSGTNKKHVYGTYYYRDIKILIFNSIVWRITVLTPDVSAKSNIRLMSDFSVVEKMLGAKLGNPTTGRNKADKYKIPICPPEAPEVEEYVILSFDSKNRLVEFIVEGIFP
jgi:hypothetical protein